MMKKLKVSDKGIELLKEFEGVCHYEYLDIVGYPTISKGIRTDILKKDKLNRYTKVIPASEVKPIKIGGVLIKPNIINNTVRVVIPELENEFIRGTLEGFESSVNSLVITQLEQAQFDALISLVYNIGLNAFRKSSVIKHINKEQDPVNWLKYNRAGGKYNRGLDNRRIKEYGIYKARSY